MSDVNIFATCQEQNPSGNQTFLLQCVANALQADENVKFENMRSYFYVLSGTLVFFMQAGFATLCAGAVRVKNLQNTLLKNLLDACGAAAAFYLVGYAFAFGCQDGRTETTFIGTSDFATYGESPQFWFFQYTFSATSVTIVAGTLAERCQMTAYVCYSLFLAGFVYPIVAHSIWSKNGFLSPTNVDPFLGVGAIDLAGGGVVHVTGGTIALLATILLGPRRGRFYDEQGRPLETPAEIPGHSLALRLLGTMILWFGWFGFNGGSALLSPNQNDFGRNAANAAISTAIAGATGGISALFTNYVLEERRTGEPSFSLVHCMNGVLSGLVSVTAGCGVLEPWAAAVNGLVAGWIYLWSSGLLVRLRIDDVVDAIPVHMFCGIWGVLSVGLWGSPTKIELSHNIVGHGGLFYNFKTPNLLGVQVCEILFILGWSFVTVFPFFLFLNYNGWLRSDSLEEMVGLDISYHGKSTNADGNSAVKKEYLEAFKLQRRELRQRKGLRNEDRSVAAFDDNNPW